MYVIILMFLVLFLFAPSTYMLLECADVEKKIELPISITSHTAHLLSHRVRIFFGIRGFSLKGATQRLLYVKDLVP